MGHMRYAQALTTAIAESLLTGTSMTLVVVDDYSGIEAHIIDSYYPDIKTEWDIPIKRQKGYGKPPKQKVSIPINRNLNRPTERSMRSVNRNR